MKQRNVMAVVCFSIITFGIYDLFWLVNTKKELNARTKQHIPSVWLLFIPILFLAAVIGIDIAVSASQANSGSTGSVASVIISVVMGIVILFAGVVVPVYWFLKYCKAVHEYTNGEMSTAVSFLLLWMLRFIGIAVIQDKFNDIAVAGSTSVAMPMNGMAAPMSPQMPPNNAPMPTATPVSPPVYGAPAPASPEVGPPAPAPQPQEFQQQQPIVQPQPTVDPTNPESYNSQPQQTVPPAQPPVPPASGPVVQ